MWVLVLVLLCVFNTPVTSQHASCEECSFDVHAFTRQDFGNVYNASTSSFLPRGILRKYPTEALKKHELFTTDFSSTIVHSKNDIYHALGISADLQLSIFSGLVNVGVSGSVSTLTNKNMDSVVAIIHGKLKTFENEINWDEDELQDYFLDSVLETTTGNYVIQRICYGYEYDIRLQAFVTDNSEQTGIEGNLNIEVSKLKFLLDGAMNGTGDYKSQVQESTLNVTISIVGNAAMPSGNLKSYESVIDYVTQVNTKINNDSSFSRGRPLSYTLVPIKVLREIRNKPDQSKAMTALNDAEVRRAFNFIKRIEAHGNELEHLQHKRRHFAHCISHEVVSDINEMLLYQSRALTSLKQNIMSSIVSEREGNNNSLLLGLDTFEHDQSLAELHMRLQNEFQDYQHMLRRMSNLEKYNIRCLHKELQGYDFILMFQEEVALILFYHNDLIAANEDQWIPAVDEMVYLCRNDVFRDVKCHFVDCKYNPTLCGSEISPHIQAFLYGAKVQIRNDDSVNTITELITNRDAITPNAEYAYLLKNIAFTEYDKLNWMRMFDIRSGSVGNRTFIINPDREELNRTRQIFEARDPKETLIESVKQLEVKVADLSAFVDLARQRINDRPDRYANIGRVLDRLREEKMKDLELFSCNALCKV